MFGWTVLLWIVQYRKVCFYLHCILVFFQFMKTKRLAFKNKICNVTSTPCMYYQHGDFVKAGQTQSEVLKIHAETTPLLMANGCYSFFYRLYQKVSHLIFLPFYFTLFILLWTPKPAFAFPTTPSRQRVFLLPYFVFGIFRVWICDGSSWQSEGDTLDT